MSERRRPTVEIRELIENTRELYNEVRRLERQFNQMVGTVNELNRFFQAFQFVLPAVHITPVGFIAAFVMQIASIVSHDLAILERERTEKLIEQSYQRMRSEIIKEITDKREAYRSIEP